MKAKFERPEQEKQSYEKPRLTKHGSIEQVTAGVQVSGFTEDRE
jgi:hypothetical protein